MLVVHTRWHPDDTIGRLLADPALGFEEITLPALSARGQALWPERYDVAALEQLRLEVGEHDWQSLYQQHPVARRGRVWDVFERSLHVVPHHQLPQSFRRVAIGVDFGMRHPGVMLVVGQTGTGDLVVLHEEVHQGRTFAVRSTDGKDGWLSIASKLREIYRPERFVADPSEPGLILALRQHLAGHPVVENAQNDVREGIRRVTVHLTPVPGADGSKRPRLLVSDRCPHLIRELETWSYLTVGGIPSETPSDVGDDACDALRYAVMALTRPLS